KAVTPTGGWTTENSIKGWKFTNDYGSVFFPATGYNDGYEAGVYGYYWSSSPERGDGAYSLYFLDGGAYVGPNVVLNKYSVRLVRAQ
ncbi:MAG: hypothetical protein IIU11_00850, partial [Bacteroidales bacterium]|nr:hypothetical protein [Bacteroidales bacterium]